MKARVFVQDQLCVQRGRRGRVRCTIDDINVFDTSQACEVSDQSGLFLAVQKAHL